MKIANFISAFTILLVLAYSCKTTSEAQNYNKSDYHDLYKVWVVDTIIVLNTDDFSTPDLEMNKNEYEFTKEGTNTNQGTRTTISSGASFDVSYAIEDGIINFDHRTHWSDGFGSVYLIRIASVFFECAKKC